MQFYKLSELSEDKLRSIITWQSHDSLQDVSNLVTSIVEGVHKTGDDFIKDFTLRALNIQLDKIVERVSDLPDPVLDPRDKRTFDLSYNHICKFHASQLIPETKVEIIHGVQCKRVARSVNSVGLYVPGGTFGLCSKFMMLSVPAKIAGCKTIVLATPPNQDGTICKEVVYCAKKAGVTHILKAGGALAISAMAWGTATCPKVWKIVGPGDKEAIDAKLILRQAKISIDITYGRPEILIIADKHAISRHVAADLLSQAEHGPESQVVLVITGEGVKPTAIWEEVIAQFKSLPSVEVVAKALSHSFILYARNIYESIRFSNLYAPQHLIVNVKDAEKWENLIENAGSVSFGPWTPGGVGDYDYASGTNHVLPTYGYGRMCCGVTVDSFIKYITVQSFTEQGLKKLGPNLATMAEGEGFHSRKLAITLRLQDMEAKLAARFDLNS